MILLNFHAKNTVKQQHSFAHSVSLDEIQHMYPVCINCNIVALVSSTHDTISTDYSDSDAHLTMQSSPVMSHSLVDIIQTV